MHAGEKNAGSGAASKRHRPHAVFLPCPTQGHITAMLHLAKLLRALHGFHISFVNTHHNHRRLLRAGALSGRPSFRFHAISDGLPPAANPDAAQHIPALTASVEKHCPAHFRELLAGLAREVDTPPVSCVVADVGMSFAAGIAVEVGVSAALFWTASAGGLLGYAQYRRLIDMGILPLPDSSCLTNGYLDKTVDFITSMEGITLKHLPNFIRTTDVDELKRHHFIHHIGGLSTTHCPVVINTFDALDHDTIQALNAVTIPHSPILSVGPLSLLANSHTDEGNLSIRSNLLPEDQGCIPWLDTKPRDSVMYINFGSIASPTKQQITHFARGLASSQQSFLWVVQPDLVRGDPEVQRVVDEANESGMLVSWCNQDQVLRHPAIGGFLTHCGWNSVIEALGCGIPLICWPLFAEQMTNCWFCCEKWGVGVEIGGGGGGEASKEEIAKVVKNLIEGERGKKMRQRAREWKSLANDAIQSPNGSSCSNIDKLVGHLTKIYGDPQ